MVGSMSGQGWQVKAASRFREVQIRLIPGGGDRSDGPASWVVEILGSGQVIWSRLSHNHTQSQHFITADSASHVGGLSMISIGGGQRLELPGEEKGMKTSPAYAGGPA